MTNDFKVGQRVKFTNSIHDVTPNTIGTILTIFNDSIVVQYNYDKEENKIKCIGVKKELLVPANIEEIRSNAEYKYNLVSKDFHIGKKFRTEKGYKLIKDLGENQIIEITDIQLFENLENDLYSLLVTDENGNTGEIDNVDYNTLKSPSFIEYNEEVERSLGEEVSGDGQHIDLYLGQRVKLKNKQELIIGILKQINGFEALVTVDDKDELLKLNELSPASIEEINSFKLENILDSDYLPGTIYQAKEIINRIVGDVSKIASAGDRIIITQVTLSNYVLNDSFRVKNLFTNKEGILTTYELYRFFDKVDYESKVVDTEQENDNFDEVKHHQQEDKINQNDYQTFEKDIVQIKQININGFDFTISDNKDISCSVNVNKDNLDLYIKSLKKLREFI